MKKLLALGVFATAWGCSNGSDTSGSGGSGAQTSATTGTASTGATTGSGGAPACEPFGRWPAPGSTFTLPAGSPSLQYADVQAAFPEVDWKTIDRLYIPAGHYAQLNLGNLPDRDPAHPLVITNIGGQVAVGPADNANYIWTMSGGSNWVLTGRYDPDAKTGDEAFDGHRCGDYPTARGHYGFVSDDAFDLDAPYLHMGVSVSDATDVEVEFVEVTRSGFAGFRFLDKAAAQDDQPMANVRLHDTYVHDTAGEGIYIGWTGGPPSNLMRGMQIYNNRFVRTGNEALQIQELGEGSHVHHNVMLNGALHFRDNGLGAYQDNNSQIHVREGSVEVDHNVFLGSANLLLNEFGAPEPGDGDIHLSIHDNYFAENRVDMAAYFNGTVTATSTYSIDHNVFRGLAFAYQEIDPTAMDPKILFSTNGGMKAQISFTNNTWDGGQAITYGLDGPDGTKGSITATGNTKGAVEPIALRDVLDVSGTGIEFWTPSTPRNPSNPPRAYAPGDTVLHVDGTIYRCTKANTNHPPPEHADEWMALPPPVDDVRVVAGSTYEGYGVH
ncbi:MAG: hypothetical protein U0414_42980 [Polyangiaceae bacterium]